MEFAIFFLFAAIAVIFALVVVLHRNPVVGALSLVASFFALAVMYVLLEAPFVAALQVIVYAGAIMVLFLFVIMLISIERTQKERQFNKQWIVGIAAAAFAEMTELQWFLTEQVEEEKTAREIVARFRESRSE